MVTRRHIAVIGAGLAGSACARALSRAGQRVTLLEAQAEPAAGASGNPIGILHPLVSKDHNLASQWVEAGMATTLRWIHELAPLAKQANIGPLALQCGVAQLTEDCSSLVSWAPHGACIWPKRFVQACLEEAQQHGASIVFNRHVTQVLPNAMVQFADGSTQAFDAVVVCAAQEMEVLLSGYALMLNAIRGTVTRYALPKEHSLPCVICGPGYATPVIEGEMVVGASFERQDNSTLTDRAAPELEEGRPMSNLDRLRAIDPRLADLCQARPATDRTSIRSATLDRMPHVGRVLDLNTPLTPPMSQLAHMPRASQLWVLGGLGSRGLTSAALGAEIIACQMLGEPLPVAQRLANAVDPVRFALRAHQRRAEPRPC